MTAALAGCFGALLQALPLQHLMREEEVVPWIAARLACER
jgi:hypothetical protein